ncbi:hypothetical protein [Klebsiella phage KL01]|uniref:Uncharacterized protein n=1 Tax=Klebsiella phage KL01 TaxID=3077152 RepID=A0AA96TCW5_9CAUD|nr:hypothetical protein [Klebsiella phage KL01]GGH32458.1 hypothetical protein GCM10011418_45980 [Sphingobacterium alkalisoli]
MQTSKVVDKISKKKVYDPVDEEVRKRKKREDTKRNHKFRSRFLNVPCSDPTDTAGLY